VLAHADPFDASMRASAAPDVSGWDAGVRGLRFGWPSNLWREGRRRGDRRRARARGRIARACGRDARAVRVPARHVRGGHVLPARHCGGRAATSRASTACATALRARSDELGALYAATRGEGFGPEVRRRILLGTYALSAGYHDEFYLKAQRARTRIVREYASAFARCDVLLLPATPTLAVPARREDGRSAGDVPLDVFTIGANLAGIPG
jgi:aspartyl-tRNA(Asn)/glutamyl-tRNA(Gln) amidotransferase subunit A